MNAPRLVIADGHLGIWGALCNVYLAGITASSISWPRCPNGAAHALLILRQIPYAESRQEAERLKRVFQEWCRSRGLAPAADLLDQDWDRMVSFYNYPAAVATPADHESKSPFAGLRLRTERPSASRR